jgi:hypothetical protein
MKIKTVFASILSLSFLIATADMNLADKYKAFAEEEEEMDEEEDEEEDDNEVELTSAIITAEACAKEFEETGNSDILTNCPPHKAFEGVKDIYTNPPKIVIVDVTEEQIYKVKTGKDTVYYYELLEGFGGNFDGEGVIVGKEGGIPVVKFEEYEITPKPKPGFFKGCL